MNTGGPPPPSNKNALAEAKAFRFPEIGKIRCSGAEHTTLPVFPARL